MKQLNFFIKSLILLITLSFASCKKDVENRLENTSWDAVMTTQSKSSFSYNFDGEIYNDSDENTEVVNCKMSFQEGGTGLMVNDESTTTFTWEANEKGVTINFMGKTIPFKVITNEKNRQEWKYEAVMSGTDDEGADLDFDYEYTYSEYMSIEIKLTK